MSPINQIRSSSHWPFSRAFNNSLTAHSASPMGAHAVIKLLQNAVKEWKTLTFTDRDEKQAFLIGLLHLSRAISDGFEKLKQELVAWENNAEGFEKTYQSKTWKAYDYRTSGLAAYESMIKSFMKRFGHGNNLEQADHYNISAQGYNISPSNIVKHITRDYDSANDKLLTTEFVGLDEQAIKDFLQTMKDTLPEQMPLIEDTKRSALIDATKKEVKETLIS